jgi:hypothetical protein
MDLGHIWVDQPASAIVPIVSHVPRSTFSRPSAVAAAAAAATATAADLLRSKFEASVIR